MSPSDTPVTLTKKQEIWKFFQFVFFSISAGIIQILIYTLLSQVFHIGSYWLAYLPALVASVLWNFTVNRKFTFKSVNNIPVAMLKIVIYYSIFTPLSTLWGNLLSRLHTGLDEALWGYIILIGTMLINFVTEFCVYRFWVYRTSLNTSEAGRREQQRISEKQAREIP